MYPDASRCLFANAAGSVLLLAALLALVCVSGCVAPEAIEQLEVIAAANEGDMADPAMPEAARRIAMENAYADHQALYLLDSDYRRPQWVLDLEAELKASAR